MDGAWPKVLETRWKNWKVTGRHGPNQLGLCFETREYPAGTEGGRYQLWFDGRWAEDITRNMEALEGAEVMSCLNGYIAETASTLVEDDQGKVYYCRKSDCIVFSDEDFRRAFEANPKILQQIPRP